VVGAGGAARDLTAIGDLLPPCDSGCVPGKPTNRIHGREVEAEELREVERDRLRALVRGDLHRARELHAEDFQLVNPAGETLSRDEYLGLIASGELDYVVWEAGEIAVHIDGDAAVIRYQSILQGAVAGQPIPRDRYWHTDTYEKREGRWQVVWSQATRVQ
jgi:ketosteroid isomerase-like protein